MKTFLDKRKGLLKIFSFLIISFIIFTAHYGDNADSYFGSIVVSVFSPIQLVISSTADSVSASMLRYFFLVGVKDRVLVLEQENLKILSDYNRLQERLLKYQRVSKFLSERDEISAKDIILANVIGFDHSNWSRIVIIDKGSEDRIKNNSNVISNRGLIGRVVETTAHYSKVMLITDARSSVDALVQRSRERGIVVGANKYYCEINYISIDSDVQVGDLIISSGMGGVIQKGLVIGKVIKVSDKEVGLFKTVRVAPSNNMNRLEEVFVSLSPEPFPWK